MHAWSVKPTVNKEWMNKKDLIVITKVGQHSKLKAIVYWNFL